MAQAQRSTLVDVTNQQLYSALCGRVEGTPMSQMREMILLRAGQLRDVSSPYKKPQASSRTAVESGRVTLADGVVLSVDAECAVGISTRFGIDEIQAAVLLRSFLYNEGLPSGTETEVDEVIAVLTPFYFSERVHLLRVLIPLLRAHQNSADPIHALAIDVLPKIIPDGRAFVESLLEAYTQHPRKTPTPTDRAWGKQAAREQLAMLEVLFWTMWGYAPCSGPLVTRVLEVAYSTNLGATQTQLFDEEGIQLQHDAAALWVLITIEVLELERIADDHDHMEPDFYASDAASVTRIHGLVTTHTDSQHVCAYLAWAFVLSRVPSDAVPRETHEHMASAALAPGAGFFRLLLTLLTTSPLFVTAAASRSPSSVTDSNAVAFRSVLKGLVIALVELIPVERIPDFDGLVEVWIALFGHSEPHSVAAICRQFWTGDWHHGVARRAIFDVARARFPIHFRPLVRLLHAMSASGLHQNDGDHDDDTIHEDRELASRHVFYYMHTLPTFSLVVPAGACTGPNAVYERAPHQAGTYHTLRALILPGGSTMQPKTSGRVLSADGGGDVMAICWQHAHSGWKVVRDVLAEYVSRRSGNGYGSGGELYQEVAFGRTGGQALKLRLEDVGMEKSDVDGDGGDEALVTDALDLVCCVIQDTGAELLAALEDHNNDDENKLKNNGTTDTPPDLVQLTVSILSDALSRPQSHPHGRAINGVTPPPRTALVTAALNVLGALLSLPGHAVRVWLYLRSTPELFGAVATSGLFGLSSSSGAGGGLFSAALAKERMAGRYPMTLSLLTLVQRLLDDAVVQPKGTSTHPGEVKAEEKNDARLQKVKEEVLLRAARFVHDKVWVEHHASWRYVRLGERFEIARRVSCFYADVLALFCPVGGSGVDRDRGIDADGKVAANKPFSSLYHLIADLLLHRATTSSIHPLVTGIASGPTLLRSKTVGDGDARRLVLLLESHLRLARLVLCLAPTSTQTSSLLAQALCAPVAGVSGGGEKSAEKNTRGKLDPVDVLAKLVVSAREVGPGVALAAIRVLHALCARGQFSSLGPSTSIAQSTTGFISIFGHLSDPEGTVSALVRIVRHPYEELRLRRAVWAFMALVVGGGGEPALAGLLVAGRFKGPGMGDDKEKGKGKEQGTDKELNTRSSTPLSALQVATDTLANWKDLWDANPALLASVLHFLDVVWQSQHSPLVSQQLRQTDGATFWANLAAIVREELGPAPDYDTHAFIALDGGDPSTSAFKGIGAFRDDQSSDTRRADLHEAVSAHAYRALAKSHTVRIVAQDIYLRGSSNGKDRPQSYAALAPVFVGGSAETEDSLSELVLEAASSSYDPRLYDTLAPTLPCLGLGIDLDELRIRGGIRGGGGSDDVKGDSGSEPWGEREYGDDFAFSLALLRVRLQRDIDAGIGAHTSIDTDMDTVTDTGADTPKAGEVLKTATEEIEKKVASINLNLSLAHAQTSLAEAWAFLFRQVMPFLREEMEKERRAGKGVRAGSEKGMRPLLLGLAAAISADLSMEKRAGDMMASIHGTRLEFLVSLLEVVWFKDGKDGQAESEGEIASFISLLANVQNIILNEAQPPSASFLGKLPVPFHRTLLQAIYFCVRQSRNLARRPNSNVLNGDKRLVITGMVDATLTLVIDALRLTFDSARTRLDLDLDRDMELLVAVFEQCTRPDSATNTITGITTSSLPWLTRLHETDVIKASLELLARGDLVGLSDIPLLRTRRQPLYTPHVLRFHMALVSVPAGAERFASQGVIAAYCNNSISAALSAGLVDVVLPELPGERSPAHRAYCAMLAIVAGVLDALGHQQQYGIYFAREVCGLVQLYGMQIGRALAWGVGVGEGLTLVRLEEMEQVVGVFRALAESQGHGHARGRQQGYGNGQGKGNELAVGKVLKVFTTHALTLVQQLNYALTHPHHLASLLEAVTPEERVLFDKESGHTLVSTAASMSMSAAQMMDGRTHPLTARLVHRVLKLSGAVVSTLVDISRAYDVLLLHDQDEWPVSEALIVPHSKVVLGEPTSVGTLLELGNCTLDVLRHLVDHPNLNGRQLGGATTTAAPTTFTSTAGTPEDVKEGIMAARRTLEATLVYAVTQLAMWLAKKPDVDASVGGVLASAAAESGDMDTEHENHTHTQQNAEAREGTGGSGGGKGRSARTLAEQLRRGMAGEMAADLQALLGRARSVLDKSEELVSCLVFAGEGKHKEGSKDKNKGDLTQVLSRFLNERVALAGVV
ncbi:hypothetical protein BJ138DRAFT_1173545, partial [Hygrophoropsis aurantiaca]